MKNLTTHTIKVTAYSKGNVWANSSFELEPNEVRNVYYDNTRGINKGTSFGYINSPMDSFVVTFDNLHSIVHYKPTIIGDNPKRYLYSPKRNIYNDSSYLPVIKSQSETEKYVEFTYTFTDNDFLEAQ